MNNIANSTPSWVRRFRLSKLFFYALVLLLPFGTRKIFLTDLSDYFGYHVFYNTFYLYLTDLVFFGLILAWVWESWNVSHETKEIASSQTPRNDKSGGVFASVSEAISKLLHNIFTRISQDRIYWFLFTFWLILAISVIVSRETYLGLYGLWKITEFILIFAYIRENLNISRETPSSSGVFWLILATLWFQAGLGIWQFVNQQSLGLSILGEERLLPGLPGIAEFFSREMILIRAYGTLPHPNVLAGLLAVGIVINLFILYVSREKIKKAILSFSLILLTTGLVVTFSRFIWAITGLAIIFWFISTFRFRRKEVELMKTGRLGKKVRSYHPGKIALIATALLVSLSLNLLIFGAPIQDRLFWKSPEGERGRVGESIEERAVFNNIAWEMIKQNPLFGAGLKNFVATMDEYAQARLLPYQHQPAHNIYLLIIAEAGILALVVFLIFLYSILKNIAQRADLLIIFFMLLAFGLFDHFFWTLQQGQLAFWILLGLMASREQ